jgi:hypothetical protein
MASIPISSRYRGNSRSESILLACVWQVWPMAPCCACLQVTEVTCLQHIEKVPVFNAECLCHARLHGTTLTACTHHLQHGKLRGANSSSSSSGVMLLHGEHSAGAN